ncbi:hypothetical protein E2C01_096468 [Portunus trituberculatus]|uniref:Uncharacterized protein n=1 Tax=Portunus trituberculatus TaxID=210409 RepID=A0A5B7JVP7_PORTR|nr:hypothetical protein [Portunus trituberculatus]
MLKPASWGKLAEADPGEDKIKDNHLQHNASTDRATRAAQWPRCCYFLTADIRITTRDRDTTVLSARRHCLDNAGKKG